MTKESNVGFKRHLVPYVVDGEAVYLVSERGVSVVDGRLAAELTPLLDGTRTITEIGAALAAKAPVERVTGAVEKLIRGGWVSSSEPATERTSAAFFEMAGVPGDAAIAALARATVRVEVYGDVDPSPYVEALVAGGVGGVTLEGPAEDAFVVAITEDYLHPGLAERNERALAEGRPWLLARPVGSLLWVGPVFTPGVADTACWSCLAHRLQANRQTLSYLQQRFGQDTPLSVSGARLPVSVATGAQLAALETVKWLGGARPQAQAVLTFDTVLLDSERHTLVRRPQCPSCGDATLQAQQGTSSVRFESRPKAYTGDGGHRSSSPEQMLAAYDRQLSPITGVVTGLNPAPQTPDGLRVYVAGQNLAREVSDLRMLKTGLRSVSCGKGKSDVQARASALGEAMERYSGVFQGDEARRRAAYRELDGLAIHPERTLLFSDRQYAAREEWNARKSMFNVVPERFDETAVIDWSPVWSLSEQCHKWMPTRSLYYGYRGRGSFFSLADSNGNAAGTSLEDAALQAFLELIERDAVSLWWYNRLNRPAIDLDSFADPYLDRLREVYSGLSREVWALDLTSDFGIPVVGAFSRRTDKPVEDILVAFGAHLDPQIALMRAMTEMNQFLGPVSQIRSDGSGEYAGADPDQRRWWLTATVENQPYLLPDAGPRPVRPADWTPLASDDLVDDVALVQRLVEDRGLEMLVLNQTRPDVGLPVAKVIVPGMRHFWARFAPGRLYDVPVELGWTAAPTPESDLNPIPIFI
jgi:bacteriocin biosynthesis cyclodehydratase domain-containing protein